MILTPLLAATLLVPQNGTSTNIFVRTAQAPEKHVTLHLNDASLKDVLNQLGRQKVDFAVDVDGFRDRKLTLNLNDVPLETALRAIAGALDAHWENVNGVRVLKKGSSVFFGTANGTAPFVFKGDAFQSVPFDGKAFGLFDGKTFKFEKGSGPGTFGLPMDEKSRAEMERALKEAQKELQKQFADPNALKGLTDAQREQIQKALENARTQMNFSGRGFYGPNVTVVRPDVDALLKSITPAQKELAKKQGYLKIADLTPEQRKLAGIKDGDKIEITVTRDGDTLRIKSE